MSLLDFVSAKVADHVSRGESLAELARDAGVQYSWLRMFATGQIPNPGIQQIERLAQHFRSPKLRRNGAVRSH